MFKLRKIAAVGAAALTILGVEAVSASALGGYVVGDCNNDGSVNSADASAILNHYAKLSTGVKDDWDASLTANCDINQDGSVNSSDASAVLSYYSYLSTASAEEEKLDIRTFHKEKSRTHLVAPKGLDPGKEGTIQYIINTEVLKPHDDIVLYNIKENNEKGGKPMYVRTYRVTDEDKDILEAFAKEHFTDEMTNYDRIEYVWNWLHFNVDYADGKNGRPAYTEIWNDSFVKACFVKKAGQCIQYNGAFAEMLAYMGYDTYLLEQWNKPQTLSVQHFASEAYIGGKYLSTEVGERTYDSPPNYYWMWLFNEGKARFHGIEEEEQQENTEEHSE